MNKQITTKYIVRGVREQYKRNDSPIVIICDTVEEFPKRRRISIKSYNNEDYEKAKLLVKDDFFELTELVVSNVTNADGTNARLLKSLHLCFNVERL